MLHLLPVMLEFQQILVMHLEGCTNCSCLLCAVLVLQNLVRGCIAVVYVLYASMCSEGNL